MTTYDFLNVVAEALQRDAGTVNIDDTKATLSEWDSIGHLSIVAALDSILDVSTDNPKLQYFDSIKELVKTLKEIGALRD